MCHDILDIFAAVADVLSGIEVVGVSHKVLADACRHAQTKVGIDIDLADCACRRLAELLLGNADCILEGAAMGIDDLYIFLRNGGGTVKDDRESGKSSCHFLQNIKAQLGIRAGFEFVSAVAGSDRDRQGINAGPLDKFLDLVGISWPCRRPP